MTFGPTPIARESCSSSIATGAGWWTRRSPACASQTAHTRSRSPWSSVHRRKRCSIPGRRRAAKQRRTRLLVRSERHVFSPPQPRLASGCYLELRLGDCGPFLVLDDRELQRSLTVEIEVADVQRNGRLHPFVDRAEEEASELLHPGA